MGHYQRSRFVAQRAGHAIDVQILRLRGKIEANPSEPRFINTEPGAGYIFSVPVEVLY